MLTIPELRRRGWCLVAVNCWRNDRYPGVFTYKQACEKEQMT